MSILFNIQPRERDLIVQALTYLAEDYQEAANSMVGGSLRRSFVIAAQSANDLAKLASQLKESLNAYEINAEVLRLMILGQKIEAIKVVRANTSLGLKEAKDYVEKLYAESSHGRT